MPDDAAKLFDADAYIEVLEKVARESEEKLRLMEIAMQREEQSQLHRIRNLERELDRINKVVVSLQRTIMELNL